MSNSGAEDVWLGTHDKTGEHRVFKFADSPDRLRALKREAALSRVVFAGMGDRAPLPALLEWNFDASPYFLEYAYGGDDLIVWAETAGGLTNIPIDTRLAVAAQRHYAGIATGTDIAADGAGHHSPRFSEIINEIFYLSLL